MISPKSLKITGRVLNKGYFYVRIPQHPNATSTGYVYEHRFVMERHLDRFLHPKELVHHKDRNRKNNKLSNLELTNHSAHAREHAIQAEKVELICKECGKRFSRRKRVVLASKAKNYFCSHACNMKYHVTIGVLSTKPKRIHGTLVMNKYHGCRCEKCKEVARLAMAKWRASKK